MATSAGLSCPQGHPIDKRKDKLKWHEISKIKDGVECDLCAKGISKESTRWRCQDHCDYDICEDCFLKGSLAEASNRLYEGDPDGALRIIFVFPEDYLSLPQVKTEGEQLVIAAITQYPENALALRGDADKLGIDTSAEAFVEAWESVLRHVIADLGVKDRGAGHSLLLSIPTGLRSHLGDKCSAILQEYADGDPSCCRALELCSSFNVPVSREVQQRVMSELKHAAVAGNDKDWKALIDVLTSCKVNIQPGTVLDELDMQALSRTCRMSRSNAVWRKASEEALIGAVSKELQESVDDCAAKMWRIKAALDAARSAGLQLSSLHEARDIAVKFLCGGVNMQPRRTSGMGGYPDAIGGAIKMLTSALSMTDDSTDSAANAKFLTKAALQLEDDMEALLAAVPSDLRVAVEQLIASCMAQWKFSQTGDSEVSEDQWYLYSDEWSRSAEPLFQNWLANPSKGRRRQIGYDPATGKPAPWTGGTTYSMDFLLMTCMEQMPGQSKGRVVPVRRYESDGKSYRQSHPPPGEVHPWYKKRVDARDSSDGLNNEFFFTAFAKAMKDAGHTIEGKAEEIFDFRFNQDFRDKKESASAERGGVMYIEPLGWKKFAVRVKGLFDDGDNSWLCLDGRPGEWAIAYHGTAHANLPGILSSGLRAGGRQAYKDHKDVRTGQTIGDGIYCTPHIGTASSYAPVTEVGQPVRRVRFVFQCRVRPAAIKRCHEEVGRESGAYWVINDASDIRPYGVLVNED